MSNIARRTVLAISGMRDNTCRERLGEALGQVKGVRDVHVSLLRAQAIIEHEPDCDPAALLRAVAQAGYRAIRKGPGAAGGRDFN